MKTFGKKIKSGKIWSGTFKNVDKYGEYFYRKASIVPILGEDGEISEFMSISFLTTEDEQQKRLLNERLLKNIVSHKKELSENQKIRNKYEEDIKSLKSIIIMLDNKIKKINTSAKKVEPLVEDLKTEESAKLDILKQKNLQIQKIVALNVKLKDENSKINSIKRKLEKELEEKELLLTSYKNDLEKIRNRRKYY